MLTKELENAIDIVCAACPYISDCEIDEELSALANVADAGAKYCDRCMVRLMYNLYDAMDDAGGKLPYSSLEWQAVINY